MKKLIITSPLLSGEIQVVYDDEGRLCLLDFRHCTVTEKQIAWFKHYLPPVLDDNFRQAFSPSSQMTVVAEGCDIAFDDFWNRYGQKINKDRCLKLWDKLKAAERAKAFFGLNRYFRFLERESWRSKADPETYLRKQYWKNDWK